MARFSSFCGWIIYICMYVCIYSASHLVVSNSLGPHGLWTARVFCPWDFPGKNTGVGFYLFLQGIFPTQGSNPGLLHCRQIAYWLSHQGSPYVRVCIHAIASGVSNSVWLYALVACQDSLSMGFPRQEYGVDCHALRQGIFLTQGFNPSLLSPTVTGKVFTTSPTW